MAAAHDMGIETDADGIAPAEFISELFEDGDIIDIDVNAQVLAFFDLGKVNTVGRKKDTLRWKSCTQAQFHLKNAHAIQPGPEALHILQDVDIGQGLAGIKKARPATRKGF